MGVAAKPILKLLETLLKKTQALLAVAALALSGAASAQVYGTVSAGVSKHDVDCAGTTSCDDTGSAYKVLGGYKFNPNIAIEGGYMNFGKTKAVVDGIELELGVTGVGVGAAFHQDFATNWNFVARLGLVQMKSKLTGRSGGASATFSDSGAELYAGLGVGYKLTKQMSLDAAMDFSKGEIDGSKANVAAFSVGLTFGF